MFHLLILTTKCEGDIHTLFEQICYLEENDVKVTTLVDKTEEELIASISQNNFDCAYIHINRRFIGNDKFCYDQTKILEYYNIPILGNRYSTQNLIADKFLTSKLSGIGINNAIITRQCFNNSLIDWEELIEQIEFPIIVKPNSLHASMGIRKQSVTNSVEELKKEVEYLFKRFNNNNEVLIEHFLTDAKEYTVSVLGNNDSTICSISRLDYKKDFRYNLNSETDKLVPLNERSFNYNIESDLEIRKRLEYHAITLFKHFGLRDFARFDILLQKSYYLIEINTCPMPGNSFSWEWQHNYGVEIKQIIALFLCVFHFRCTASGRPSRVPQRLLSNQSKEIIDKINHPKAVDICPECSGPNKNCNHPELYTMNDRVSSETEVYNFLKAITYLLKPKFILETGTYKGVSTCAFTEGILQNNYGHIISLEINSQLARKSQDYFKAYPVEIINIDSLKYQPSEKIDILYLDSKRILRKDEFIRYLPFLHDKSVIIWHDSAYRQKNHAVFDTIEDLYNRNILDRLLLPTPRGLTLSMLKGSKL